MQTATPPIPPGARTGPARGRSGIPRTVPSGRIVNYQRLTAESFHRRGSALLPLTAGAPVTEGLREIFRLGNTGTPPRRCIR